VKIGIVLCADWGRASIDFDGLGEALIRSGNEAVLLCRRRRSEPDVLPVVEASDEERKNPAFWRAMNLSAVIFLNWLRAPEVAEAILAAGIYLIAQADSDGLGSVRVFPRESWLRTIDPLDSWAVRVRKTRHWLNRFLYLGKLEDAEILKTAELSDCITIESPLAAENLMKFFRFYGKDNLCERIRVVPHTVRTAFIQSGIELNRPPRIFCGGRWDDPQKDANLLARVLTRIIPAAPEVEVVIAGRGGAWAFKPLAEKHPQVKWLGQVPRETIPDLLKSCQFLLSSSQWESYPIGTLEALCLGCTFVGPPLPSFLSMAHDGEFGTVSSGRSVKSLADATLHELQNWKCGRRDPLKIASWWRGYVNNDVVAEQFLGLIRSGVRRQEDGSLTSPEQPANIIN
jgi:glycosyltransferase involved in cell wall biosynthesis